MSELIKDFIALRYLREPLYSKAAISIQERIEKLEAAVAAHIESAESYEDQLEKLAND